MTLHAARLARVFTPEYARRINAQIVHPNAARVVKPNELESALARPLQVSVYEPARRTTPLVLILDIGLCDMCPTSREVAHKPIIASRCRHPFGTAVS